MNFDELQSAWNSDEGKGAVLPETLQRLKSAHMPVTKLRKNMRKEFIMLVIIFSLMGFFPLLSIQGVPTIPFYAMYTALIMLTVFHLTKFYRFYQRLHANTLSSKDNLYEVYYDIKLNIEMYKSFNYSIIPLIMLYLVMIVLDLDHFTTTPVTPHKKMVIIISFVITFIVAVIVVIVLVEWWVSYAYGKYLRQVGKLLDELREA
ncbi:hypothetical protein SAMN04488505_101291 [Chitinophaga rupis]|uniref:Uncharacterized protein n=1 Tax=Chitinophaga rupis TaxID=573321 RepID=A0A1H7HET0_9BACT|nr:hypothetical protein [Chitinophaga rupis]SEK48843.1 hypothetical protein SAMN04488505_101291 [Chitinophaga rupis]